MDFSIWVEQLWTKKGSPIDFKGRKKAIFIAMMETPERYVRIQEKALTSLEVRLDPVYSYHCVKHTRDVIDNMRALLAIAETDGSTGWLLVLAACLHDVGYINGQVDHEESGVKISSLWMRSDFDEQEINEVSRLILSTRMPQQPKDHLERLLCDADLGYLGSPHYFQKVSSLVQEWKNLGKLDDIDPEGLEKQISFFQSHRFHTMEAKKLWDDQKLRNLELLLAQRRG